MLNLPSRSALQNLLRWLAQTFAPLGLGRAITTREQLIRFLDSNAAYIAQKCAYSYCHARMGKLAYGAFQEPYFQKKMEVCRWEGYAVILSDLVLCTAFWFQERLNKRLGAQTPDIQEFGKLYRDVLALHPVPPHRKDWRERQKDFERRIAFALKNRPLSVKQVADIGGKALLDLVPMGQVFKDNDEEIFLNTVRLCQMNADHDLRARCNPQQMWSQKRND